jgi:hypothetical protein
MGVKSLKVRNRFEDLSAIVVFDFPHAVSNLKPETTIQWNKTNEELYEIGLANIRGQIIAVGFIQTIPAFV